MRKTSSSIPSARDSSRPPILTRKKPAAPPVGAGVPHTRVSAPARKQVWHLLSDPGRNGLRAWPKRGTKNLVPYLRLLESKKLISTRTSMGKKFYLVHDPRIGIQHLIDTGKIVGDELEDLNQLCSDLKQEPFEVPRRLRRPASEAAESEIQGRA